MSEGTPATAEISAGKRMQAEEGTQTTDVGSPEEAGRKQQQQVHNNNKNVRDSRDFYNPKKIRSSGIECCRQLCVVRDRAE
jgi:hypothetical protein